MADIEFLPTGSTNMGGDGEDDVNLLLLLKVIQDKKFKRTALYDTLEGIQSNTLLYFGNRLKSCNGKRHK